MTKPEQAGLFEIIKGNTEVMKELLVTIQQINAPILQVENITGGKMETSDEVIDQEVPEKTVTPAAKIPEPVKVTIEDCRDILAAIVSRVNETVAWDYLKSFGVTMLPELDESRYAELVSGAQALLTKKGA